MKRISPLHAAWLLLCGTLVLPALSQENKHEERQGNPKAGERQAQHRSPQQRRPQRKPRPQNRSGQHDQHPHRPAQQAHDWQQHRGWQRQGAWKEHDHWEGGRTAHWQSEHRTWAQRGGYGGRYIPRNNYRLYFGEDHGFRIQSRPVMYMGYPRFGYRGYSFIMVDPWPEDWDANWYASDDVYIDYDDGYYLYNRSHPGIGIAVTVVQ